MEISAFLDRKLARRFATYDADGDGFVEESDFELSATSLAEEFGHGTDSPARKEIVELSLALWRHLAGVADVNLDRRISLDEYRAAFAAGLLETTDSFDAGYRPFLDAIMRIADVDGDGKLTSDDHVRWTGSLMGLPEHHAHEVHRRLDRDGDGYITTDDLLEAIREYYFDEDPDSAGTWLLGPLDED